MDGFIIPPRTQARAKLPQLQEAMLAHFEANRHNAGNGLQLLPGVLDLFRMLKVHSCFNIVLCLS